MKGLRYLHQGPWPAWIGLCVAKRAFDAEMRRLEVKEPPPWISVGKDATVHIFDNPRSTMVMMCLDKVATRKRTRVQIVGLLVHECAHIWQRIKEEMGEEAPGREVEAYAMQHLVQNMLQAFEDL